jgi:very-short-patch-repair endonuclease
MTGNASPFPLEGGRAGDGGVPGGRPKARPVTGAIGRARRLRRESTLAERILWAALRKLELDFRRQAPIGPYVADFAHHQSKVLIEIDGYYHGVEGAAEKDAAREAWLTAEGFRVVRFSEREVRDDLHAVVDRIVAETASPPSPALPPSRGKGEGAKP